MGMPSLSSETLSQPKKPAFDLHTLQQMITEINSLLSRQAELVIATRDALHSLAAFCEQRFQTEEESPLYSKPSEQMPSLADRIGVMLGQHRSLREQLAFLKSRISQQQGVPAGWTEFAEQFADFERQVRSHEHAEIHLWGEAYSRDVGTKD